MPRAWAEVVGYHAPGLILRRDGRIEVHRTHLPLFAAKGFQVPATPEVLVADEIRGVALRPWQKRMIAWATPRRGTLIVAEPRMGKTAASLLLHEPAEGPLVIFAPLDVHAVWKGWVERVFPGAKIGSLVGHTVDLDMWRSSDVIIGHYDVLSHHQIGGMSIGTLIVDEAHVLARASSGRSVTVRVFAPLARRVVTLTGTPLWNKTEGLWPLLTTANPGAWGHRPFGFKQRYCSPVATEFGWSYGTISNADEWHARIPEVAFQAGWRGERPDLTPTIRQRIVVDVEDAALHRLDVAAASIKPDGTSTTIGAIAKYRKATGMIKAPIVAERALEISADRPVVVWAWHKEVAQAVAAAARKAGREATLIHGDRTIPAAERVKRIDAWRQSPKGVLCATLAVGQVGIDLSHADHAIMGEFDWTPAVNYQGEMRTFDPARPMTVDYVSVGHPVEVMAEELNRAKLERAEAAAMPAAGSDFSVAEDLSNINDLLSALARKVAGM